VANTMTTLTVQGCKDQLDKRCRHECVPVHLGMRFDSEEEQWQVTCCASSHKGVHGRPLGSMIGNVALLIRVASL